MNDDDIMEMMHSTFINKKTSSNEGFTFDEFYTVVVAHNKWGPLVDYLFAFMLTDLLDVFFWDFFFESNDYSWIFTLFLLCIMNLVQ